MMGFMTSVMGGLWGQVVRCGCLQTEADGKRERDDWM